MTTTVPAVARLDLMTVEEYMHPGVVTCDPDTPLVTAARMLADERIHCLVVAGIERTSNGSRCRCTGVRSNCAGVRWTRRT